MVIHADCRHFHGDRPCLPHKREGVHCGDCPYYEPTKFRILIIKLDAVGDVLRTTCILDALHAAHPGACVEWLTREPATYLFEGNPLVDRAHSFPGSSWLDLLTRRFDLVINLDNAPLSSQLASLAQGSRKIGFGYHPDGYVHPFNDEAREWYEMGLFDDVKRRNAKTYQQIALEICGLPTTQRALHLYLSDGERRWAEERAREWGLSSKGSVIGLNTGAGARWPHKKWTEEGFVALIGLLRGPNAGLPEAPQVLLLGGPAEVERNACIARRVGDGVLSIAGHHPLRRFCSLVNLCDLIVTGDTLALHVAVALDKMVVALFGPTSAAEIDLYGRGVKLVSDAPCVGCYRTECDVLPTCMERISAQQVHGAILGLLAGNGHQGQAHVGSGVPFE